MGVERQELIDLQERRRVLIERITRLQRQLAIVEELIERRLNNETDQSRKAAKWKTDDLE